MNLPITNMLIQAGYMSTDRGNHKNDFNGDTSFVKWTMNGSKITYDCDRTKNLDCPRVKNNQPCDNCKGTSNQQYAKLYEKEGN
jgi:hypothetical protein